MARGRPRKIEKTTQWEEPTTFGLSRSSIISGIIAIVVIVGLFVLFNALPSSQPAQPADEQKQEQPGTSEEANKEQNQEQKKADQLSLPTTHTVTSGENLWKISEKYYGTGYGWVKIAGKNALTNADQLEIGQKLIIPKAEIKTQTHTVAKGDTLWDISVKYYGSGFQWQTIAKVNASQIGKLPNGNLLITPGQKLIIP